MTDLITDSKDERLEFDTLCPQCGPRPLLDEDGACASCGADAQGPGVDEVMQSLRAALKKFASWDNINKEGPDEPTVFITKERYDRLTSVETRAEKAETALCRARAAARRLVPWTESAQVVLDALSSPAPCRHEEEAKGWLHPTKQLPPETDHKGDTVSQEVLICGTARFHYPTDRWCRVNASWKPVRRAKEA